MRLVSFPRARAVGATTVGGLAAIALVATSAAPASADVLVHAKYKVTGSTFIKAGNFTVPLGPGNLASTLDAKTGKITATLTLPEATASYKQDGLIPVTATTKFINDGPTTGSVNFYTDVVSTTSKITLQIVSLSAAGVPVPVGSSCETTQPATVPVSGKPPKFSIIKGGTLTGTYTIPQFANCGLATTLINLTIPGPGNTITLHLGKATITG